MRALVATMLAFLLTGCFTSSPQKTQFKAEYPARQDIRQKNEYRFTIKPTKPADARYWGSDDLAELFYVADTQATTLTLHFNFPAKSLQVSSQDPDNKIRRQTTFMLLDESAEKPSDTDLRYMYLTKDGRLLRKTRSCKPDMSVGCQWWIHTIFITRNGDMAVSYEKGGTGLVFLVIPLYSSSEYLQIFNKAQISNVTSHQADR